MRTEEFDDMNVFSTDYQEYDFLSAFISPFEKKTQSLDVAKLRPLRNYRFYSDKN